MTDRRRWLQTLGLGAGTAAAAALPSLSTAAERSVRGLPPLKITRVRPILTAPEKANLVVVKVETSEPGLYGLGCATFTQRAWTVAHAVEKYIDDFARGRDADAIEDMWQNAHTSSYWRNGP